MTNGTYDVRAKWQRKAAIAFVMVCGFIYAVRGFYQQEHELHSYDFKTVYGSSRCLIKGCDPYDSETIFKAYLEAGGPANDLRPFRPHEAVYLPSALAMVAPIALMPWGAAHLFWLALSTGTFLLGAALISRLCLPVSPLLGALAMGFLLVTSTMLMMLAQPVQLTVGMCAIAVWCLTERRYLRAGVLCFAIALVFKPHVAGPVWLYFLLAGADYRKQALRILLVTILMSLPGILWATEMPASSHWMRDLPANLEADSAPGMTNDPGPLNKDVHYLVHLQTIIAVFRDDPAFYNGVAHAIGAVLLGLWLVPVFRMQPSKQRDYLALASIVCISFLPTYHRAYDACLLLLIFPAFALLTRRGLRSRWWTLVFTLVPVVLLRDSWAHFASHRLAPMVELKEPPAAWQTILLLRPSAVACCLLAGFYLANFYTAMARERRIQTALGSCKQMTTNS